MNLNKERKREISKYESRDAIKLKILHVINISENVDVFFMGNNFI